MTKYAKKITLGVPLVVMGLLIGAKLLSGCKKCNGKQDKKENDND